jgi:predicted negative regulator of RcsB-dependent stress response
MGRRSGRQLTAAGDPVDARAVWQQALRIRTDLDHPDTEAIRVRLRDLDLATRRVVG